MTRKWWFGAVGAAMVSLGTWWSLGQDRTEAPGPRFLQGAPIDGSAARTEAPPPADPVPEAAPTPPSPAPGIPSAQGASRVARTPAGGHGGHGIAGSAPPPSDGTYQLVTFDDLGSFEYIEPDPDFDAPDTARPSQIPAALQDLGGKRIGLEGYIYPIGVEKKKLRTFVLSRYVPNCCFGQLPNLNEWVDVEMSEGDAIDLELLPYGSALVTGIFDVGEQLDEYGYVLSIFRMKADAIQEQW